MTARASTAAGLGALLVLTAAGFDSPSLFVPGLGLIGLAGFFAAWVELARPQSVVRARGPRRVVEGDPYPLRIELRGARVPPPGGVITDPLLERPVALGPRSPTVYEATVPVGGRGRRLLSPA